MLPAKALATFLIGLAGALGAKKLRLPAITGSMFVVLIFSLLTPYAYFPIQAKPAVQAIAGGIIGLGIDRQTVSGLKKLGKPLTVFVGAMFAITLLTTLVLVLVTPLSPTTALLSCAPGGVTDMSLMATDLEAEPMIVACLQMLRMIVGIGVFPSLTRLYLKRHGETPPNHSTDEKAKHNPKIHHAFSDILLTLAMSALGGAIGYVSKLPAAPLTFSLITVAAFQMKTGRACIPPSIRIVARIIAGAVVICGSSADVVWKFHLLIIPFLIVLVEYLIINFLLGPFLSKRYNLDLFTTLLACTPAGASDMALMAEELGGDQAKVIAFQIVRLVSVLLLVPLSAKLFLMVI